MLHRRFWVLLGAAATAVACWKWLPGTAVDHLAFTSTVGGFANPPFFISGNGSHTTPWEFRTFTSNHKPDPRQAPAIVSLGDDLEGFFQSSPPSPIDLAVIFTNFQRLGAKNAATAVVLAWESPDPIGLAALDKAINRFDSLIMAAPLSRGAVPELMPPAFRNASIPLAAVHGDTSALPIVNRIPLPGVILGAENTRAGFQVLNNEPLTRFAPLLARWEDRVVFAFPLLAVLQRHNLPVGGMEIRLGEFLKLGPHGPIIPIDRFGRLAVPLKPFSPYPGRIPAEALIDGTGDLFPKQAPPPVILRDDRSAAEPATRAFSGILPAMVAAISSETGITPVRTCPRLPAKWELIALSWVILMLTVCCGLPAYPRNICFLIIAGCCIIAQTLAVGIAAIWLPGIPALAALMAASVLAAIIAPAPAKLRPAPVKPPPRKPSGRDARAPLKPAPVKPPPPKPSGRDARAPLKPAPAKPPSKPRSAKKSHKKRKS